MNVEEKEKWYYFYEDIPYGPVSIEEIKKLIKDGTITETVIVHKGIPQWKTAKEMGLVKINLALQDLSGSVYPLLDNVIKIGRAPDNNIVISIPSVSRYHAEIKIDELNNYWIENLKSKSGVVVNGNIMERAKLDEGIELQLGKWIAHVIRWDKDNIPDEHTILDNSGIENIPNKISKIHIAETSEQEALPTVLHQKTDNKDIKVVEKTPLISEADFTQICPSCNNKLPLNALFCGFCGTKIKKVPLSPEISNKTTTEVLCFKCNKKIDKTAKFCPYCGAIQSNIPKIPVKPNQSKIDSHPKKAENTIPINKCPNCNKELLDNSKFCGFCGTKIS